MEIEIFYLKLIVIFYLSITTLTLSISLSDTISKMYIPSLRLDTLISKLS